MSKIALSLKQIYSIAESNKRMNFWMGATGGGKTFSSILKLIDLIQNGPPGDCMILGVSRGTIQRNVITTLYDLLGWPPPPEQKTTVKIYGRNVYLVGCKDERSVATIQGSTLAIAYVDELPKLPKPVFKMLQGRCRVPHASILATGNPEGPSHWFKKEYLDNAELDIAHFKFLLDDNPSLDEKFKENIRKEYTGVWYKRLIEGEWAAADGLIYDCFDGDNIYDGLSYPSSYQIAGIDYGTSNATCCVVVGVYPKSFTRLRVLSEYYYDSRKTGRQKTDSELAVDISNLLRNTTNLRAVYVDPSALSLRLELDRRNLPVMEADNDVVNGIKIVTSFLHEKQLKIHRSCENLIDSIYSYVWDSKAADRGEDAPLKENDHACDALRYGIFSHFPDGEVDAERESWSVDRWKREMREYDPMELLNQGF